MRDRLDSLTRSPARDEGRPASPDWPSLFQKTTADAALEEVASWLGAGDVRELVLDTVDGEERRVASFKWRAAAEFETARRTVPVPGDPPWKLTVLHRKGKLPGGARIDAVGEALVAWRAVRAELERVETDRDARTRELVLLQEFGRASAEARDPESLFRRAASLLEKGARVDAVVIARAFEDRSSASAYVSRRMAAMDLERMADHAGRLLGWTPGAPRRPEIHRLDAYEETPGPRGELNEEELVVVPIFRGGRPAAALAVLLPEEKEEAPLRLVFGAANQISLHLDRILTVREIEQDRFRSILDSMPQAVLLADDSLRVLQTNPAADRLLRRLDGWDADRPVDHIGNLDVRPLATRILRGDAPNGTLEAVLEDGTILDVTLSPVAGGGRRPEGLVLVIADVTESRRLQQQLAQTEKLSSLGQMISGIAHELNNPLAAVVGFAQMTRSAAADEKLAHRLEVIDAEAQRCQKIVRNLLSFARRHDPETKPLSLNEVVGTVIGLIGYQLRVDNIEIRTELDRDLPVMQGDVHQLQQALLNLITNAQDVIREAGRGGVVTVRTRAVESDRIVLEVRDDGPGMTAEVRTKIFDPFFTTKPVGKGTGLGLSLVYGIVTAHGGEISLDTRRDEGTTFRIEFPARRSAKSREPEPAAPRKRAPGRRGRILVIDDEDAVAGLIVEALQADGHTVERSHDREQALGRLSEAPFDLIVLDLRMPGMGEQEFREAVETRQPGLAQRMVLTTGDTVSGTPEESARKTGLPVVQKPFDLQELREAVQSRLPRS